MTAAVNAPQHIHHAQAGEKTFETCKASRPKLLVALSINVTSSLLTMHDCMVAAAGGQCRTRVLPFYSSAGTVENVVGGRHAEGAASAMHSGLYFYRVLTMSASGMAWSRLKVPPLGNACSKSPSPWLVPTEMSCFKQPLFPLWPPYYLQLDLEMELATHQCNLQTRQSKGLACGVADCLKYVSKWLVSPCPPCP